MCIRDRCSPADEKYKKGEAANQQPFGSPLSICRSTFIVPLPPEVRERHSCPPKASLKSNDFDHKPFDPGRIIFIALITFQYPACNIPPVTSVWHRETLFKKFIKILQSFLRGPRTRGYYSGVIQKEIASNEKLLRKGIYSAILSALIILNGEGAKLWKKN